MLLLPKQHCAATLTPNCMCRPLQQQTSELLFILAEHNLHTHCSVSVDTVCVGIQGTVIY